MKRGTLVTPRGPGDVFLFNDHLERSTDAEETLIGDRALVTQFKPDTTAIVVGPNPDNTARVQLLYRGNMWWGNESELLPVGGAAQ